MSAPSRPSVSAEGGPGNPIAAHVMTLFSVGLPAACGALFVIAAHEALGLQHFLQLFVDMPLLKQMALLASLVVVLLAAYILRSSSNTKVLLVDTHCFQIPERFIRTRQQVMEGMRSSKRFSEESLDFMSGVMDRNGLGDKQALPQGMRILDFADASKKLTLDDCLEETRMVIFDVADNLLQKTGIAPQEVDIVMTSCNTFAPTPSMAAMLVNRFGMRRSVKTYSFNGMGSSSALICVDLARHMLKAMPNSVCLVVNHENVSASFYEGNDRSMLVCNSILRLGGAAALLSNRPCDQGRAKYELVTTQRTHLGAEDEAHLCMGNDVDAEGNAGVFQREYASNVAIKAVRENLVALAPRVLPLPELAKCALDRHHKPDFKHAFEHFLLHTGGRSVLDSLEKELELTPKQILPAKKTLERFGNLSAASTWYILAHIEGTTGVRYNDRILQLGFGSGFKANSAVWRARRNILQPMPAGPECR